MAKSLVIVESPTKAKTISRFLNDDYKVEASFGHVRDLPTSKMGVDIENNFEPKYVIPPKAKKRVADLKKLAKGAPEVILATDEDREGEAIAWHLIEALDLKKGQIKRIAFHEVTKTAIAEALKNPRQLDLHLVDAQQARRILDRLVGYELSPFLWKKVRRGLSAGRVQSVAVRLIVEREREIIKFKPQEYWSIEAVFNKDTNFIGKLSKINGKTLDKLEIKKEESAQKIISDLRNRPAEVIEVTKKEVRRTPSGPFTTSTMQQEAARKLGFSAKQTMMYAQQLYEGVEVGEEGSTGLITYMRTDSTNLSEFALASAKDAITQKFGKDYLLAEPRRYTSKSKNAQEAHEAIRPTDFNRDPESIKSYLDKNQFRLYDLIWKRSIATQMPEAIFDATSVDTQIEGDSKKYIFRSTGQVIKFDGFMKVYLEGTDEELEAEEEGLLPELKQGDKPKVMKILPKQHFTQPPPRFTDASLIKTLEEAGIGRPSTYAPTITTIQERDYVNKIDKRFHPTEIGFIVNDILVEHFPKVVDLQFTAKMEEELDEIAAGEKEWVPVIKEFYGPFKENLKIKEKEVEKHVEQLDEKCPESGHPLVVKFGRFGKFIACSNYPECKYTRPMPEEQKLIDENSGEICEKCGKPMVVKFGRFGSFLGCSGYPECKNIKKIQKGTGVECPKCGEGELVERRSKRGIFYSCSKYPQCKFLLNGKPTGEKCPKTGDLLIETKNGTIKCSNKECDFEKQTEPAQEKTA
ncbi:MAG TPA: type I DNA topoisomerase [Patescibacteria group bacterium]|jgi:DNA topoisomerase-1|nr:type I DNA topoisomerase [Patescibacteria group bacterium]